MQPDLKLVYNSQAGNGWLGIGWDLSLGSIQRSTKKGVPAYAMSDTFLICMGGQSQELVDINVIGTDDIGSYREYRAQIESGFMRLRYYASPKKWRAWSKDGKRFEFKGLALHSSSDQYFYWGLSEVADTSGNYMTIEYPSSPGGPPPSQGSFGAPYFSAGIGGNISFLPSNITYTSHNSGLQGKYSLTFTYDGRPDELSYGMAGFQQKILQRVANIQVLSGGLLLRKYEFQYQENNAHSSVLTSIKQYGSDLNAPPFITAFSYQTGGNAIDYANWNTTEAPGQTAMRSLNVGDFNGDSLSDVVYYSETGGIFQVGINNGTGLSFDDWASGENAGTAAYDTLRTGDFDNDGATDVVYFAEPTFKVGLSRGNHFDFQVWNNNQYAGGAPAATLNTGDFNGDGLSDIVYYHPNGGPGGFGGAFIIGISTGSGFVFSSAWNTPEAAETAPNRTMRVADFNGDGLSDIVYYHASGVTRVGLSKGDHIEFTNYNTSETAGALPYDCFFVGDFTGDGLTDVGYYVNSGIFKVGINVGNSFVFSEWRTGEQAGNVPFSTLRSGDFNGDGLTDVAYYHKSLNTTKIGLSNGDSFDFFPWNDNENAGDAPDNTLRIGDFNNDGLSDFIYYTANGNIVRVGLSRGPFPNHLTQIKNPLGGTVNVTYGAYKSGSSGTLPFPVQVVQSVAASDGRGNIVTNSYSYSGGLYDRVPWLKKEFLGFREVRVTDGESNYEVSKFLQNDNAVGDLNLFKGRIYEKSFYSPSGVLQGRTSSTYTFSTPFTGVYFPYVSQSLESADGKITTSQFEYDSYGNLVRTVYNGDLNVSGDERTSIIGYALNTNDYLVAFASRQVLLNSAGNAVSESWVAYDGNSAYTQAPTKGLVTKMESRLDGGNNPIVTRSYDAYGNLTDEYDARWNASGGSSGSRSHWDYDATHRMFSTTAVKAMGSTLALKQTYAYDWAGRISAQTDANGQITQYVYDSYGRPLRVVGPNDSDAKPTVAYSYFINAVLPHQVNQAQRVRHGENEVIETQTFFDGMGRTIYTKSPYETGYQTISEQTDYNPRGMPGKVYVPYTVAASTGFVAPDNGKPSAATAYDVRGRVTWQQNPDGTFATKEYVGWTETVTDENGNKKDFVKDSYGQIVQVKEHNDGDVYTTQYAYDAKGNLTRIDKSNGDFITITYDSLGRKTALSDPQMGNWAYSYDANGNLTQQTDSKNQTITMSYDRLNRLLTKSYPDSKSISYTYDSGNFAKGRLSSVKDLVSTQTFTYDNLGQMISKERIIDSETFVTETEYDALGRETAVTYPNGDVVRSTYTGPMLAGIRNASNTLTYAAFAYHPTAVGKPLTLSLGNGVITTYVYTNNTFLLTGVDTRGPSNEWLQDFGYDYDHAKNITQITSNGSNQNFSYDDLNRLVQAVGPYGTQNYSYDKVGNILSNPDNAVPLPGYLSGSDWTSSSGAVQSADGRLGQGMSFNGTSQARLNNSEKTSPQAAMTVDLWVRPLVLDGPALISKAGSFAFARLLSSGGLEARLSLSSGDKILVLSSGSLRYNLWHHLAMTYDGANIKVYVNGQLKATQAANGAILPSSAPVYVGGAGFQGSLDEINIQSWALSANEVLARYQSMPNFTPSQPKTPESVPNGITTGQVGVLHKFKFLAWDLDGDNIKYRINWGDGNIQETGLVPSGSAVEATHAWSNSQTYSITAQAIQVSTNGTQVLSTTSPAYNFFVDTATYSTLLSTPLTNAVAVVSYSSSHTAEIILGEPVVSTSVSSQYRAMWGYQERVTDESLWWSVVFGSDGLGGTDPNPTDPVSINSFMDLSGNTTQEVATIAAGLRQNPNSTSLDANGNTRVARGRWIQYDYDNRPIKVITTDGSLTEFAYDFEGNRVKKAITRLDTSESTLFIGTIYEQTGSNSIQYIYAGAQRIALKKNTGVTEYFLPDHLGGTNLITNNSGAVIRTTRYMPFGSTYETSGTEDNDHKYTGQRLDDTTGLYFYIGRYYDPSIGKFITPDTIVQAALDPQSLNRYSYVRNNPIVNIDPSGHSWLSDFVDDHSFEIGIAMRIANLSVGYGLAAPFMMQSEQGRNYLAGEMMVGLSLASLPCGGCTGSMAPAISGGLFGGLSGGFSAHQSGGDLLTGTAIGAAQGAAFSSIGAMKIDPITKILLKGQLAGGISALQGGDYVESMMIMTAFGVLEAGYAAWVGEAPNPMPGKHLGDGDYPRVEFPSGRPGQAVFGSNEKMTGNFFKDFWKQNGAIGKLGNITPNANAGARLHDNYTNAMHARGTFNLAKNIATMLPGAVISYGGLMAGAGAPLTIQLTTSHSKSGK